MKKIQNNMNLKNKFQSMIDNKYNGNISDFRKELKGLNKSNLLRFAAFCATFGYLDIYEIEKHFNA